VPQHAARYARGCCRVPDSVHARADAGHPARCDIRDG
jgi:hypothetical protein